MFPRQQDVKSPASRHSEMHTPRSIHSRTSNQRQELSPYVGGRKNYEYVNPLYGGNKVSQDRPYDNYNQPQPQPRGINISQEKPSYNYNQAIQRQQSPYHQKDASPYNQQTQPPYFQQETPKTPQRGPKSVISNSSSNSEAIDMVCTNCINKHLMMEKKERDRMEKEKDQLLRQINESNYQNAAQKENEKQRYLKEQYKNDSNIQLEQINNKKVRDENLKKSSKDQNNQSLINPDKERMQRLSEMQNDLKKDLLRQINAKENEKKNEKLNNDNYKMTLDIGNDFRPRSALPQNYRDDLREQILLKENQKQMEKENDIKMTEAQKNLDKKINEEIQNRKHNLENQRKEDLKKAYQDFLQNQMKKKQDEWNEKESFNQSQQKLKDEIEKQQYQDYYRRKDLQKTVGDTIKNQIEYNNIKKKIDKNETSSPGLVNLCMHKNKMVSCSECSKKYPKQQLSKRSESPLKLTPKKYFQNE